ncbi:hypothetical protein AB3K78_01205 [Leucobacter sp. HNU]|uniref:hypothetical protein n=1 Tax=Leucobacter sp. HNU TaxID=3236805 RepID=UPI003A80A22D
MKIATLLRTAATWLTDHRDQISQIALAILAGLWKLAKLLIGTWIVFVGPLYVYRLWAGLDGDPEKEALVISCLFFAVALALLIRYVFRLATSGRQAPTVGAGMGVAAPLRAQTMTR